MEPQLEQAKPNHAFNGAIKELELICNVLRSRCATMAGQLEEIKADKVALEQALAVANVELEQLRKAKPNGHGPE
jgi:hypothetical protein